MKISLSLVGLRIYPSRTGESGKLLERLDPVIYSQINDPGPLDRERVRQYDKDGFLILENVFSLEEVDCFKHELDRFRQNKKLKVSDATVTEPGDVNDVRSMFGVHEARKT